MLDMDLPWWEFIARAAIVYTSLLVMVRLSGKRTVGQFTPFDLLVVMLLSESVSGSLGGSDASLTGGLIAAATLVTLNVGTSWLSSRSRKVDEAVQGRAVLVGRDGALLHEVLRRERVPEADVEQAFRSHDCTREEMHRAYLESDGEITIVKKKS